MRICKLIGQIIVYRYHPGGILLKQGTIYRVLYFVTLSSPMVCSIRHFHISITEFDDVANELTRKELIKRTFYPNLL